MTLFAGGKQHFWRGCAQRECIAWGDNSTFGTVLNVTRQLFAYFLLSMPTRAQVCLSTNRHGKKYEAVSCPHITLMDRISVHSLVRRIVLILCIGSCDPRGSPYTIA